MPCFIQAWRPHLPHPSISNFSPLPQGVQFRGSSMCWVFRHYHSTWTWGNLWTSNLAQDASGKSRKIIETSLMIRRNIGVLQKYHLYYIALSDFWLSGHDSFPAQRLQDLFIKTEAEAFGRNTTLWWWWKTQMWPSRDYLQGEGDAL